jgi:hypothetical protein
MLATLVEILCCIVDVYSNLNKAVLKEFFYFIVESVEMGRKIPGRKHRGVRDPEKQQAERLRRYFFVELSSNLSVACF